MNILRAQTRYEFCPPKYARWFRPILHMLSAYCLRRRFNIRGIRIRGVEALVRLVRDGQSVLVIPNHADHADPGLLVQVGRRHNIAFHFMAAREGFERSRINRFILQKSGAFSVDREGTDLAAVKTAMAILRECHHPLVIFPEGEIYHRHEELDVLNDGVATILLRSAEKFPGPARFYAVPAAIRITHDAAVARTFSARLNELERRITWKPRPALDTVERIYQLGGALISIKEQEFMGEARNGGLSERIQILQQHLVEEAERKHNVSPGNGPIPARIKTLRQLIRKELIAGNGTLPREREDALYDDLDRLFAALQLYSYRGGYLRQNPTPDRIAETILKLEEDVIGEGRYPAPRRAEIQFDEPIDAQEFLRAEGLTAKTGVQPLTELLRQRIQGMLSRCDASKTDLVSV